MSSGYEASVQRDLFESMTAPEANPHETPDYLKRQLVTYIGNKRRLLDLIGHGVDHIRHETGGARLRFLDLFAGSGVVSRAVKRHASFLHVNDQERYAEIVNRAALADLDAVSFEAVAEDIDRLNRDTLAALAPGFITDLYAPADEAAIRPGERVFYTRRNAMFIDTARRGLEDLPPRSRLFALASLIQKASVHTNTSGVFKGFYKDARGVGKYGGDAANALTRIREPILLEPPILSRHACPHHVTCMAAEDLVSSLDPSERFDVAYLDPPYNQHPYGSNYFMLNLIADYRRPEAISTVSGIPRDWNRSRFNKRAQSRETLFSVIRDCPARHILLSYNCEGFIDTESLVEFLSSLGDLKVFDQTYNTFRGCRNLRDRDPHITEYLFVLKKEDDGDQARTYKTAKRNGHQQDLQAPGKIAHAGRSSVRAVHPRCLSGRAS